VAGGEIADIDLRLAEGDDLRGVSRGQEAPGGAALVEQLDRPRVQAARPRPVQLLI
jgi:hypothetical protein